MITYVLGDIFTSPVAVLVNTVNTRGVMGMGIAKDFKTYFPEMFVQYQRLCELGELRIGRLFYYRSAHKSVLNFPTKRHWRDKSSLEILKAGLETFIDRYEEYSITSIAFPQLGCGNGELNWDYQVRPLMERFLGDLPIKVYIHLYDGNREFVEHRSTSDMKAWLQSEPEALPFSEVWEDILESVTSEHVTPKRWHLGNHDDEAALYFEMPAGSVLISSDDLRSVWYQLRSVGFLAITDLPDHISAVGEELLELLTALGYIQPAEYSSVSTLENAAGVPTMDFVRGIKLVPRPSSEYSTNQLSLFGVA